MSLQQVNLYHDELRDKKLNYSAIMLLQLSLIIIVALSVMSGLKFYQVKQHELILEEAKKSQEKLKVEKNKIEALRGKKDSILTKKIEEKTKELSNKQNVIRILSQDEFGNAKGFVGLVGGLARQRLEGLWLTHLRFSGGGTNISLRGITYKASLLPKYLQRLSAEKAFSGMTFQNLTMDRNKEKKQWLNFSMQNITPVEKEK